MAPKRCFTFSPNDPCSRAVLSAITGVAVCLFFTTVNAFAIGLYDTPPLAVIPYQDLKLPAAITKSEMTWMLQTSIDQLNQKAFVDFGDRSDYMHMHLILRPKPGGDEMPAKPLTDADANPDWNSLSLIAALIHTQEYDGARNNRPYVNLAGHVIDNKERNQLLLLQDTALGRRGQIINAAEAMEPIPTAIPMTIDSSMLRKDFAGSHAWDWELSFYFYRASCAAVDAMKQAGKDLSKSNVIEVHLGCERACLALVSYHCENSPEDSVNCSPYAQALNAMTMSSNSDGFDNVLGATAQIHNPAEPTEPAQKAADILPAFYSRTGPIAPAPPRCAK